MGMIFPAGVAVSIETSILVQSSVLAAGENSTVSTDPGLVLTSEPKPG